MAMSSMAAFVAYTNAKANEEGVIRDAFQKSFEKTVEINNLIPKEERGILKNMEIDATAIAEAIPELISGYMKNEGRSFTFPAPDNKTTSATLKLVDKAEETKTGTIQFGPNAGQEYSTTVEAHTEFAVKNNRNDFKK